MGFAARFVLVVVGIGAGMLYLQYRSSQQEVARPAEGAGGGAPPSPVSSSAPLPATPAVVNPVETPPDTAVEKFREMARQAQVDLVGYRRDGDWFVVTIRSTDRTKLLNFLDVAQRFGLKNIDVKVGPQYREFMGPQGRLIYEATHRMKF